MVVFSISTVIIGIHVHLSAILAFEKDKIRKIQRPMGLNGHLSYKDSALTSCQLT